MKGKENYFFIDSSCIYFLFLFIINILFQLIDNKNRLLK